MDTLSSWLEQLGRIIVMPFNRPSLFPLIILFALAVVGALLFSF